MVTALVLQLIQCSVKIEKKCEIEEEGVSPDLVKVRFDPLLLLTIRISHDGQE